MCVKVTQSCLTLCDLMAYTVHGILQARILEWVAFSFSRGSSQPRDRTQVSHIAGRFFTSWATREAPHTFIAVILIHQLRAYMVWRETSWNEAFITTIPAHTTKIPGLHTRSPLFFFPRGEHDVHNSIPVNWYKNPSNIWAELSRHSS